MGRPLRKPCEDCGAPMDKQHRPGKAYVCAQCGTDRGARQAMALHRHEPWALRPWAAGLIRAGVSGLAEADLREVLGDAMPAPAGAKIGDPASTSRPQMRRNREVRERQAAEARPG